jgi:hypothetical protein
MNCVHDNLSWAFCVVGFYFVLCGGVDEVSGVRNSLLIYFLVFSAAVDWV